VGKKKGEKVNRPEQQFRFFWQTAPEGQRFGAPTLACPRRSHGGFPMLTRSPLVRTRLFTLAWAFIVVVAAYDMYFTWCYRAVLQHWELNPLACEAARLWGVGSLVGLRAATIAFGVTVGVYCHLTRHRLTVPYTLVVGGAHAYLLLHYLFQELLALAGVGRFGL
jgi:hypothetical protein